MDTAARRPDRTLLVAVIAVVALVVVALIVVFTRGGAAPVDAASPAGVVQRYTEAVIDGDEQAAREYLVEAVRSACERVEAGMADDVRVTLDDTTERDRTADVDVSIVSTGGGLLGTSEYREEASFELVREGADWRIETTPWQFTICLQAAR